MGKQKRGRSAKKARSAQLMHDNAESEQGASTGVRSFVFQRGSVGRSIKRLVSDIRRVMEPNTATSLKARKNNSLRDFVTIAGPLGVTHFVILTRSDASVQMRVVRVPHGPTLTFKVESYVLSKDVVSSQKHPVSYQQQYINGPLLVMNDFTSTSEEGNSAKLTQSMFQNLFQALKVHTVKLREVKRCVLMNRDPETGAFDFRHYAIQTIPAGVTKSARKLVKPKLPDLGKYEDISDFFHNPGQLSESEYECEIGHNEVESTQELSSRGCKGSKSLVSLRLTELGPRMTLKLLKIESGVDSGEVLYHSFIKKTPEEIQATANALIQERKLKMKRKKQQELNVQRKLAEKEQSAAKAERDEAYAEKMKRRAARKAKEAEEADKAGTDKSTQNSEKPKFTRKRAGASSFRGGGKIPDKKRRRLGLKTNSVKKRRRMN